MSNWLTNKRRVSCRLLADEEGVTSIEYGLLAALIVVVCIAAFQATGNSLGAMYATWTAAVVAAL